MPKVFRHNAIIVFGLAALFYCSFMFAKHDPMLRRAIPFGDDPYDAVGSFGVVVGVLIALLSLVRAFRRYRPAASITQQIYLLRAQQAVILAVFITLASDAIAMARHPGMWNRLESRTSLIALLGGMVIFSVTVQVFIQAAQERLSGLATKRWKAATRVSLLALLVLMAYPEHLIERTATHLLTIIVGAIVLFAPMRLLLRALVPYASKKEQMRQSSTGDESSGGRKGWRIALLIGFLMGACAS